MNKRFTEIETYRRDLYFSTTIKETELKFQTTWGLFSPRGIDEGSQLLLENIIIHNDDTCLDVGCGYGPLGVYMAKRTQKEVHCVDKDFVAIEYTKKNMQLNHINHYQVYLSNGFNQITKMKFSLILSNLPAKVGNEMLSLYMLDAYHFLAPKGRFYVVTINGMRKFIQRLFKEIFGNYEKVKQGKTYTVAMAEKLT